MTSPGPFSRRSAQSSSLSRASFPKPTRRGNGPQPNMPIDGCQAPQMPGSPADLPHPVAALLQATAIPVPRKRGQRGKPRNNVCRRIRIADSSNPQLDKIHLDAFLSGSDELMSEKSVVGDETCDVGTSLESSLPVSLLSLDNDGEDDDDDALSTTLTSDSSSRSSGGMSVSPGGNRKVVSSPEECLSDHPLQSDDSSSDDGSDSTEEDNTPNLLRSATGLLFDNQSTFRPFHNLSTTFRSNFTSSLRALRAAAHSVSNFATPSVWVDNTSDRKPSFHISPELTDDKRPNLLDQTPSPALRRYLNPGNASTQSIKSYCKSSEGRHKPLSCTSSIQLQTYSPSTRRRSHLVNASSPSSDFSATSASPAPRHREPRENGDFLRMLVLEQGMRRQGKLSPSQPRKAQVWLPPRKFESCSRVYSAEMASVALPGRTKDAMAMSASSDIPQRWVSLAAD